MLIVGRAIAGRGSSGLINGALTILAGAVPMHKRPGKPSNILNTWTKYLALIGFMMSVAQLGLVLGPLVGGALTIYTTWRWCTFPCEASELN